MIVDNFMPPTLEERYADLTRNNIDFKVVLRLPRIPNGVKFQNARLIGSGVHSEVYCVTASYKNKTITAVLKIFSQIWKERFEAEVHSYEFFEHSSLFGVIPIVYGCDKD